MATLLRSRPDLRSSRSRIGTLNLTETTIDFMEEKLYQMKIQMIIEELGRILTHLPELEKFWLIKNHIVNQIKNILSRLRFWNRDHSYKQTVNILARNLIYFTFPAQPETPQEMLAYKISCETAFAAIDKEIDLF